MSYPYLSDVIKAWAGIDLPLPLATFGLFVALGALVAGALFRAELQRLYEAGKIGPARVRGADMPPQDVVSDFMVVVMVAGVLGARLFHILEHTDQFAADPMGMIFTRSGLSIFGGLILGTLAGMVCVRRWRLPVRPLLDAAAPAMMIGYAIGRIGCQVSGDGDWGIAANMALKPEWLPTWLWTQTYDNNIYGELIALPGVYPTPMYETAMALLCFAVLWALRKHAFRIGWLFSVYLVLAGVERLLIEQIRVNPVFNVAGLHATQAEIIAVALIALGAIGAAILSQRASAEAGAGKHTCP
ncbi:prolipoprotein diacylglyceryl transferase [Rugamonas sp. FT103W]|uniref:Phosphatidylglycerol--prolipoprotein diacylglyceryl transferase n=1 Tax=Rugamonas rivuli TaxID=2743358 RepID=A0A843SAZ3_9BURK|nr:prolipoprotein diacylglyceryl transferase [Rugamonas rivuli]